MWRNWDIAKEALGFFGAVLMALPWGRDFWLRITREWVKRVPARGSFAGARDHFVDYLTGRIDRPKHGDLAVFIVGILLLAGSFAIGFAKALFGG